MNLTIDAISGRHGRDPDGTFALDWEGKASGHVTCLNVSGNKAYVGVVVDAPAVDVAADATPTPTSCSFSPTTDPLERVATQ